MRQKNDEIGMYGYVIDSSIYITNSKIRLVDEFSVIMFNFVIYLKYDIRYSVIF